MNKRDVLELKKRLTKKDCTFTKMSGCYVNSNKEIVLSFTEDFRDLREEEYYKYLDIASKILSGTIGNNLLELDFFFFFEAFGVISLLFVCFRVCCIFFYVFLDS